MLSAFFEENRGLFRRVSTSRTACVTVHIDRHALIGRAPDPDLLDEGYVLDITRRGTAKLAGQDLPRERWVRDVTEIRIDD